MKNIFARKITKKLLFIPAKQLLRYLSKDAFRRFLTKKLLSSNSIVAFQIIDAAGKADTSEGWIKQEYILRFLAEMSLFAENEHFYHDLTSFFRNFWDNFAGCFGIDSGSESERYMHSKKILDAILAIPREDERKRVIVNIFDSLKKATYLASGANRYVPLAIFIINLFYNNNIYSIRYLPRNKKILKLLRNHLFYNKLAQYDVIKYDRRMFFPKLPSIVLPTPNHIQDNTKIQWLDIGCAPKKHGSPTLSLLKDIFKQCHLFQKKNITFKFTGTDVYFPYYFYKTSTKEINVHEVFSAFKHGVKKVEYNDITYLNANCRINDVATSSFMSGREKEYHFISACKVMHHFIKHQPIKLMQLAERIKVNNKYKSILWDANDTRCYLSKSQQRVIESLLRLLKIGGFLLLDLSNPSQSNYKQANQNFFLIIQRLSNVKIKLYNHVIPYDPDSKKVYPHAEYILRDQEYVFSRFCSRSSAKNKRDFVKDYKQLKFLMRQLDIFVYCLQSKDNIPNQNLHLASEAFKNGARLIEACKIYLKGIHTNQENVTLVSKNKKIHRILTQTLKRIETIEDKYRKSSQDLVNVMIIGCGGAARDSYIPGIVNVSNVNLASIVIPGGVQNKRDAVTQIKFAAQNLFPNDSKCFIANCVRQITQLSKGKKILDYDQDWFDIEAILDKELHAKNINAIIIGSPEGCHHKYIEWALKHRLSIACDKPLTSRIGVTTDPLGRTNQQNKIALATELINDYDKYIEMLNKINRESLQELQFEILTKKRYSKVVTSINEALHKSPAKIIQIFTADGWWLTPAQLARTDIFTMYGMHGHKSDGGKLVHTAAHFLDLAIMFAREGRANIEHERDIVSADITVCFIRGYDSAVRSNNKAWLDIEASSANIVDQNEKHIPLKKYFNTIKKLPEINLSLQIKLTFSDEDVVYIQLMGLHEGLAKMANKYADYKQRFQSRTKVDHIFILQNSGNKIEYKRLSKVKPNATDKSVASNKHHELYIGKKKIEIPFEEDIDTKPVIRFLENIKLSQSNSLKPSKIVSHSSLIRHEYDVKILAAIYKRVAEHYINSVGHKTLFKLDRQLYFKYLFNDQANHLTYSEFTDSNVPYFKVEKINHLDKDLFNKVEEIRNITKYGIISIQCITFGGIFGRPTKNSAGFTYLDDLIALVQFSYEGIQDEKLVGWQILLHKEPRLNMLTVQIIFYGQKNNYEYIACQLQLFAINIYKKHDELGKNFRPDIHSLSIAQGPFALTLAKDNKRTGKINLQTFYSKELLNQVVTLGN